MKLVGPLHAKHADYPPVFPDRQLTAAQRAGLSYEKFVIKRLQALHNFVMPGPWLYYKSDAGSGICQPDALVWLSATHICIVECKLTWQRGAREKIRNFYGPIVSAIYPDCQLSYLQVYKNYKRGCHKRPISLYKLSQLKPGEYRECQNLM